MYASPDLRLFAVRGSSVIRGVGVQAAVAGVCPPGDVRSAPWMSSSASLLDPSFPRLLTPGLCSFSAPRPLFPGERPVHHAGTGETDWGIVSHLLSASGWEVRSLLGRGPCRHRVASPAWVWGHRHQTTPATGRRVTQNR